MDTADIAAGEKNKELPTPLSVLTANAVMSQTRRTHKRDHRKQLDTAQPEKRAVNLLYVDRDGKSQRFDPPLAVGQHLRLTLRFECRTRCRGTTRQTLHLRPFKDAGRFDKARSKVPGRGSETALRISPGWLAHAEQTLQRGLTDEMTVRAQATTPLKREAGLGRSPMDTHHVLRALERERSLLEDFICLSEEQLLLLADEDLDGLEALLERRSDLMLELTAIESTLSTWIEQVKSDPSVTPEMMRELQAVNEEIVRMAIHIVEIDTHTHALLNSINEKIHEELQGHRKGNRQ
jgi:hypothetical protein